MVLMWSGRPQLAAACISGAGRAVDEPVAEPDVDGGREGLASAGARVPDIVDAVAITAVQSQARKQG